MITKNKNFLIFTTLMFCFSHFAFAQEVEKACKEVKLEGSDNGNSKNVGNLDNYGSSGLSECLVLVKSDFKTIIKNGQNFNWNKAVIKKYCKDECKEYKTQTATTSTSTAPAAGSVPAAISLKPDTVPKLKACVEEKIAIAGRCVALAYLLEASERDWENETHTSPQTSSNNNSQPQVQGQTATQQNNGQTAINANATDNYGCKSKGIETLDYEACKAFSDYAQGLDLSHQAINVGQNLYYQNKSMDNAFDASKNAANDATAGLKAQKNSFKDQQEYYTQNSAIEASKAAILLAKYNALPDAEEVKNRCKGADGALAKVKQDFAEFGAIFSGDALCKELLNKPGEYALLMNQKAKDAMKQKLIKLGINALSEGAKAYMAGKRADQVSDAIAQVNSFQPVTTPGLEEAVETTFCQMNPTAEKCQTAGLGSSFSTIGDNIVEFGSNGTGTVYSGASDSDSSNSAGSNSGTTSTASKTGVIGSAITSANKGSGLETKAAPATITKGNGPSGGGGGGGGGLGGGGGGGGGAPAAQQAAGATSAIASKSNGKYSGGSGVSVLGGLGIKGAKKTADNSNPFGNMFDKKAGADKVLNFRGPASDKMGGKGDNLFDMISKRYGSVSSDKRLIEYEEITK